MAAHVLCVLLILIGCMPVAAQIHDTVTPSATQATSTGGTGATVIPLMDIRVSTAAQALALTCTLLSDAMWSPDGAGNVGIELVHGHSSPGNRTPGRLASIGADNPVVKHVSRADVYVDGYFNTTVATHPYVSVTIREPVCSDGGLYYCALNSSTSTQVLAEANVTVCSDVAELDQVTTNTTPTHSVITCRLAANQSASLITFMQISWQAARTSPSLPLAFANVSENDGLAAPSSDFAGSALRVSGHINQSRPEESKLEVEFPSETCADTATGTFDCLIKFVEANSSISRLAGANLITSHDPCDDQKVDIRVTLPAEELGAMIVTCTLLLADLSSDLSYFEVRRSRRLSGDYDTDENLASVGPNSPLRNNVYWSSDVDVVGHFDSSGATTSYISITFHKPECDDRAVYGCFVTSSNGSSVSVAANVTLCNNITEVTQVISHMATLTPGIIKCHVSANQNVSSISAMQIFWRRTEKLALQPLVVANASENGGAAALSPAFSGRGFAVSGQINQTHPDQSQLIVDFPSDTCENIAAGTFDCFLKYTDRDDTSKLARSQLQVPDLCDDIFPGISVKQRTEFNPANFEVFCGNPYSAAGTLITMELSLLPNTSPLVRRQIAYLDSFLADTKPTVNTQLAEQGVTGRTYSGSLDLTSQFSVSFSAGTCKDTGLYRCTAVYKPMDGQSVKVKISEERLPACLPDAVTYVESSNTPDGRWSDKFACRVNSTRDVQLVSMEVSVMRDGSRHVLAYINSFLNGAEVGYVSEEVTAEGEIYPFDPNASSLNVTSSGGNSEVTSLYTATCKLLFSGTQADPQPVIAMADGRLRLAK